MHHLSNFFHHYQIAKQVLSTLNVEESKLSRPRPSSSIAHSYNDKYAYLMVLSILIIFHY